MVRNGGKVCWGDGTGGAVIPSKFIESFWIPTESWRPAQAPYTNPAPNRDIYLPTSGNAYRSIEYAPGIKSVSTVAMALSVKAVVPAVDAYAEWKFYWITDNADTTNGVGFEVGARLTRDMEDLDIAVTSTAAASAISSGAYYLNEHSMSFPFNGTWAVNSFITAALIRNGNTDIMPGSAWVIGSRLSISAVLS